MMLTIGIDPGKHGGIAAIDSKQAIIDLEPMKESAWFDTFIRKFMLEHRDKSPFVFLEKAQSMPGNGIVGVATYMHHAGVLEGVLIAHKIPYELVPPRTWCKEMHAGANHQGHPKDKSREIVKRLFPDVDLTNPDIPRSVKIHEGIMDALLIAEYGRRKRTIGELSMASTRSQNMSKKG